MTQPKPQPHSLGHPHTGAPQVQLRLLETTDVHVNLLPFDYYTKAADQPYGLARTATLIRQARADCDNCLLLDNGDFLQGSPLGDITAQPGSGWAGAHPAILAMNQLGYDAATLGNHEFNFGLDWLQNMLTAAAFPITCANVVRPDSDETPLFSPYLILEREVADIDGHRHNLKIGLLGLLPPQITTWDQPHLHGRALSRGIVETAEALVPAIRAAGADIIVALAHTGVDASAPGPRMENAALPLARVAGIDAILAGHSHQVFPGPMLAGVPGVDAQAGTFHDTPAVMAGFRGSHLGVLDLFLQKTGGRWQVARHASQARAVATAPSPDPIVPADPGVTQGLSAAHAKTLQLVRRPVGRSEVPLHSYLALVRCDPANRLVTRAQRAALRAPLADTPYADLPILSATAPFKSGGRGGPDHYTDVPAGPLCVGHAAGLYPFPNTLCALHVSGRDLRDWLERSAICFNRLVPGQPDQPLCNPAIPGHNFDIIDGLSYQTDLSQPARYNLQGQLIDPTARRIRNLRFDGQPLADDARFILATNSYRAFGAGPYASMGAQHLVYRGHQPIRDLLTQYIASTGVVAPPAAPIWQFVPMPPGTTAVFETGPGVRRYPAELRRLQAEDLGLTSAGFCRLRLPMSAGSHVAASCNSIS